MKLKVKKLYPDAHIPTRAHPGDSGLDLRAYFWHGPEPVTIYPGQTVKFGTAIAVELPEPELAYARNGSWAEVVGYEAQVRGRSGLSSKGIIACGGIGTVDNGYRGEIGVALTNTGSTEKFVVNHGDKIAQLVVVPVVYPDIEEVTELSETPRGDKGFGSTGA